MLKLIRSFPRVPTNKLEERLADPLRDSSEGNIVFMNRAMGVGADGTYRPMLVDLPEDQLSRAIGRRRKAMDPDRAPMEKDRARVEAMSVRELAAYIQDEFGIDTGLIRKEGGEEVRTGARKPDTAFDREAYLELATLLMELRELTNSNPEFMKHQIELAESLVKGVNTMMSVVAKNGINPDASPLAWLSGTCPLV